jgi:hypothetical protein
MRSTPATLALRKRGRPPVDDAERRELVRCTRLTHAEAEALAARADADSCPEGDVLRAALAEYLLRRA